jgi:hypothetical protein
MMKRDDDYGSKKGNRAGQSQWPYDCIWIQWIVYLSTIH